jgi:Zn-dependent protease
VLIWLALTNVLLVVFNLSPLLEFDGYYVLSDWTNTNGLRKKALRFVFRDLADHPHRPASRAEGALLAFTGAAVLYVIAMVTVALAGVPKVIETVLPSAISGPARVAIGVGTGIVLAAFMVFPFITEAVDARRRPVPTAAGSLRVEPLEQRVSKSDLSAALGVKTGTVDIRPPSEVRGS